MRINQGSEAFSPHFPRPCGGSIGTKLFLLRSGDTCGFSSATLGVIKLAVGELAYLTVHIATLKSPDNRSALCDQARNSIRFWLLKRSFEARCTTTVTEPKPFPAPRLGLSGASELSSRFCWGLLLSGRVSFGHSWAS